MITIALPVYKSKYLSQAIESVLNQSYKDFELIILNDGSPDDIDLILSKFKDKRIRYYKNEYNIGNNNLVEVWNKCLDLAIGEYFVLFSDDDIYYPDFLGEMIQLAERYPNIKIFHCRVKEIDDNNKTITYTPLCPEWENVISFIWHRIKLYRYQYAPDFMCKTNALKEIGGFINFPLGWGSDDATWFTIAKNSGIVYSPKVLCKWRFSSINISKIGNIEQRLDAIEKYLKWVIEFIEKIRTNIDEEGELIKDIKNTIPEWNNNAQKTILLRSKKKNLFGNIKFFYTWLLYRKKYNISFNTLLWVIASKKK